MVVKKDDFTVDLGVNFSFDKNEIKAHPRRIHQWNKKWKVGKSLYEFFIRQSAGVDPEDGYQMWYKDELSAEGEPTGKRVTTKDYSEATRYYMINLPSQSHWRFQYQCFLQKFDMSINEF